MRLNRNSGGQALVEFALVFPIFAMALFAIIIFGLGVFYQQQLSNAARDAARYAAIHSSSAQCPTVSSKDPLPVVRPDSYLRCDSPETGWPRMTAAGRNAIWGMNPANVAITACWSGYQDTATPPNPDALPQPPNTYVPCLIGVTNPQATPADLGCPPGAPVDTASDLAAYQSTSYHTTVTVYACFNWSPPMAGFLLLPSNWPMRAVVTEVLQRQQ